MEDILHRHDSCDKQHCSVEGPLEGDIAEEEDWYRGLVELGNLATGSPAVGNDLAEDIDLVEGIDLRATVGSLVQECLVSLLVFNLESVTT